MRKELMPIIIGSGLPKEAVACRNEKHGGFDVFIKDLEGEHVYGWLKFPTRSGLEHMIDLLQQVEKMWDDGEIQDESADGAPVTQASEQDSNLNEYHEGKEN